VLCSAESHNGGHLLSLSSFGGPSPSGEDGDCTERLVRAGTILNIRVLDHIIVGSYSAFFRFNDSGLLELSV
jgi:DNA repair protein RadC